jgi:hypothetical protein
MVQIKHKGNDHEYPINISMLNTLTGNDFIDDQEGFKGWSEKKIKQFYLKNEAFILGLVGVQHPTAPCLWIEPGHRPSRWWELSAPEKFEFEFDGDHKDRVVHYSLARFEYLKTRGLLFEGEEKHFYDRILEKFDHLMKLWSFDAAKKHMRVELEYMKNWQKNHQKSAKK